MAELKVLVCDVCGGMSEGERSPEGWISGHGVVRGETWRTAFLKFETCSGACLAEYGMRLSLSQGAFPAVATIGADELDAMMRARPTPVTKRKPTPRKAKGGGA